MKTCTKCHVAKDKAEFYPMRRGNLALGHMDDSVARLSAAITYLKEIHEASGP